jgi:hypothetical protein
VRFGGASRDDTNDFFVVFLIFESDVTLRNRVGIIENENGRFEANSVLVKVLPALLRVPFKSHGSPQLGENTILARACQYICMYVCRIRAEHKE